jgi:hypothetical protein
MTARFEESRNVGVYFALLGHAAAQELAVAGARVTALSEAGTG